MTTGALLPRSKKRDKMPLVSLDFCDLDTAPDTIDRAVALAISGGRVDELVWRAAQEDEDEDLDLLPAMSQFASDLLWEPKLQPRPQILHTNKENPREYR